MESGGPIVSAHGGVEVEPMDGVELGVVHGGFSESSTTTCVLHRAGHGVKSLHARKFEV